MTPTEDPAVLAEQIYQSEGYEVYSRLEALASNHSILARNYEELRRLLQPVEVTQTVLRLWDQRKSAELEKRGAEVGRLFHNFLASVGTLVDTTRVIMNEFYEEGALRSEYEGEKDRLFAKDPLIQFVQGLRNYSLHYRLAPIFGHLTLSRDQQTQVMEEKSAFMLDKGELLRAPKWSRYAKQYLRQAPDEIPIFELVDEYYRRVTRFHIWLDERLRVLHKNELDAVNEKIGRLRQATGKAG